MEQYIGNLILSPGTTMTELSSHLDSSLTRPLIICPIAIANSMGQIVQKALLPRRAQRFRRA